MASEPTIQIKVPPTKGNEAGIVTINLRDFNPAAHERWAPEAAPADVKEDEHEAGKKSERQRKKEAAAQGNEERR